MGKLFKFLFLLIGGGGVAVLVMGAALFWYLHQPLPMRHEMSDFTVERGFSMRQTAGAIVDSGVDIHPEVLYWLARGTGKANSIVAGSYEMYRGVTPWQLMLKLSLGDVSQGRITLTEGWTFRQVRQAIEALPDLQQDTAGISEAELLRLIEAPYAHAEGLFFPDTYLYDKQSNASALFRRAWHMMENRLGQAWLQRSDNLPLQTPYEALILASIIEKETGQAGERDLVSSVFINRLRIGMKLQTDPTVIYGLGDKLSGRLRRIHLDTDHEYNTYTRTGLPPTPIAMPGWASLLAAVNPPDSPYLYFVARGDGSSEFSRTLTEHNHAVNRYQRQRQNVK